MRSLLRRLAPARIQLSIAIAAIIVAAALALWRWHREAAVFDDAYITYRYAWNLVHGHGLVYNPGERVEGYSNFAWVILSAAALAVRADPLQVTRAIGLASHVLTIALLGAFLASQLRARRELWLLSLLALLVLPTGYAALAGSGLETAFVALLLLLLGFTQHLRPPASRAGRLLAGVLPLILCLTRLDAALAIVASALATAIDRRAHKAPLAVIIRELWSRFAIVLLGMVLYLLWKRLYYGELLPNTYYAKAADRSHLPAGYLYVATFLLSSPQIVMLLPSVALAVTAAWATHLRALVLYCVFFLTLFVVYVIKVGGDFMFYRFLFEAYPLYVLLAALGLLFLARRALPTALTLAACALVSAATPPVLEPTYGMQSLTEMDRYTALGHDVGRRFHEVLPRDTVISTTLAGIIAYDSELTTIDQWGLNDREVAHQPSQPIHYRGHSKAASDEYLRRRGVNLVLAHPVVCSCSAPCRERLPNVFVRLDGDRCVRTWYLSRRCR